MALDSTGLWDQTSSSVNTTWSSDASVSTTTYSTTQTNVSTDHKVVAVVFYNDAQTKNWDLEIVWGLE
jgi:hypothetical protein